MPICPNCGAVLAVPAEVEQLTVHCGYCKTIINVPDRAQRVAAQQQQRRAERNQALAEAHLRSAQALQRRVIRLVFSILLVTMGLVFYRVFVGTTR
jgi:phage FluMu protein Com